MIWNKGACAPIFIFEKCVDMMCWRGYDFHIQTNTEDFKMIDTDYLYEFCLDWQMEVVGREQLKADFIEHGWDFEQFKKEAMKFKWFVTSMEELSK